MHRISHEGMLGRALSPVDRFVQCRVCLAFPQNMPRLRASLSMAYPRRIRQIHRLNKTTARHTASPPLTFFRLLLLKALRDEIKGVVERHLQIEQWRILARHQLGDRATFFVSFA